MTTQLIRSSMKLMADARVVSTECAERGCMAHDDRVDGPGVVIERQPLTDEEIDALARTMVKGNKSVNWLARAIEAAHGIGEKK